MKSNSNVVIIVRGREGGFADCFDCCGQNYFPVSDYVTIMGHYHHHYHHYHCKHHSPATTHHHLTTKRRTSSSIDTNLEIIESRRNPIHGSLGLWYTTIFILIAVAVSSFQFNCWSVATLWTCWNIHFLKPIFSWFKILKVSPRDDRLINSDGRSMIRRAVGRLG